MVPVGMAMLFRTFPPAERVRASSIMVIPTAMAPALGPVIGGLFVTELSWRWVFYVNVPIGVAAVVFGLLFLGRHEITPARGGSTSGLRAGRRWPGPAHVRDLGGTVPRLGQPADRRRPSPSGRCCCRADLGGAAPPATADRHAAVLRPAVPQLHSRVLALGSVAFIGDAVHSWPCSSRTGSGCPPSNPVSTPSPRRSGSWLGAQVVTRLLVSGHRAAPGHGRRPGDAGRLR